MSDHAILSPSAATRWITCTPSARLELTMEDTAGQDAAEGTLAHSLGELILKRKLRRINKKDYDKRLSEIKGHSLYDKSMLDHCTDYAVYVMEVYAGVLAKCKSAKIFLETLLDMSKYVPEGFGTGDVIIIADDTIYFIDFKYGKGVPVYAENNKQLMLYALGAIDEFELLYNFSNVVVCIYQPRIDNITSWEIEIDWLKAWAADVLIPKAKIAFAGTGDFIPGDHCKFCKAKGSCKANGDYQMELAKYSFKESVLLSDDEVVDILQRQKDFINWAEAVAEYALKKAVEGKQWPGMKLVSGRSNRQYTSEQKVKEVLLKAGYKEDDIYFPAKLKGITEMEKVLGKADFGAYLNNLLTKPYGSPTLVPESDKRGLYDKNAEAKIIFAE